MEQLPMLFSPRASTGATILALQIASMSITGWRTIGLVWRASICLRNSPRKRPPMRPRRRCKSLALPNNLTRFERHQCIGMLGNDSCGVVARGPGCGDLS